MTTDIVVGVLDPLASTHHKSLSTQKFRGQKLLPFSERWNKHSTNVVGTRTTSGVWERPRGL
jgi:hypothetical protein